MKKYFLCVFIIFLIFCPTIGKSTATYTQAESLNYNQEISTDEFQDEIGKQLEDLDFSSFDEILSSFSSGQIEIFGGTSFIVKLLKLISGEFDNGESLWKNIINLFFDNFLGLIPMISLIITISLLGNMLQGLKPSTNGKSISNIINFVTYGIIVILVLSIVVKMITLTSNTLFTIKEQMDVIFPILLTFLTAIGGSVSASVYQPAMALLTGMIINVFTYLLLPLFIFSVAMSIVSNLSNNIKLDKFTSFFNSTFKWITGLIFTIFSAFVSIQGLTAGSIDGISMRTMKYAIKSYIPMLGGYISDGMGLVLASSNLIKNAVGASGLFMLLATVISPLLELILFMLALKLIAAIVEPLGNKQIASFISMLSKSVVLLIVILIGVSFIYFIMLGLVMCSANII